MRYSLPIFLLGMWLLPSKGLANTVDKADLMGTEASVAKYERKAVINFAQVWVEESSISLPVTYCTITKKEVEKEVEGEDGEKKKKKEVKEFKKCNYHGAWRAEMTPGWVERASARHINTLVTPRYDQILVESSQLQLITPNAKETVEFDFFTSRPRFEVGSYRNFKAEMLKSLNQLAPALKEAQNAFNSARYQDLPDQEKGTFMAEQAKSAGIPLSVYERLSTSTYAFGIFIPKITGSMEITKTIEVNKSVSYGASVEAPLDTKIIVFRFDGEAFSIDLERRYGRGFGAALGRYVAGGASTSTDYEPTQRNAQYLFERTFNSSLRDSYIALGNELKKDRRFALQAPIEEGPKGFNMPLGLKDGLRARHPFRIYRTIDGKEKPVGRVRVDSIADNCKGDASSALTRRGGSIEDFDLAVEEPYGGGFWGFSGGTTLLPLHPDIAGIRAGFHFTSDLAYLSNSTAANDWYLHLDVSIASFSPQDAQTELAGVEATLGFERRYYLPNSSLYVGLEPRIGFQAFQQEEDQEAQVFVGDGLATLGIDLGLSANLAVFGGVRAGIVMENTLAQSESMALQAMAGVSLSFSFGSSAGLFGVAYAPDEGCQKN